MESEQQGAMVWDTPSLKSGGCNTCTRESHFVWAIRGHGRTVEFRVCDQCMSDIVAVTRPKRTTGGRRKRVI